MWGEATVLKGSVDRRWAGQRGVRGWRAARPTGAGRAGEVERAEVRRAALAEVRRAALAGLGGLAGG